ncbi:hypothetical protein J2Z31_002290 [Sinorhizobium kostiense]|uniref:Uncharacterized protein n=1 Tax=Sinorhizobium kostiense TaxID=76747 RepID=A0ABS4QYS9_9HYPH|nr:hypothetical protein [Sinorhizobium kostiense]
MIDADSAARPIGRAKAALAVANHLTLKRFRDYVAPRPVLSEIGKRAAISYYPPMARNRVGPHCDPHLRRFG